MHVAVDLDDVVLDFVGGVRAAVKKEFGVELKPDDVNRWELGEILDPIIGRSWWSWLEDREWLWSTFPAIDGAMGGLERLRREGHYLELVTSKPRWAEHNVWKWLGKWRPPFNAVTIVAKDDVKRDFTRADLLVDDKPQNLAEFDPGLKILFDRPHNRTEDRFSRAGSWLDVVRMVQNRAEALGL
jgi:5'(3')-deoxyribonucleotidase